MLTAAACSCLRNGRKISAPVAKFPLFPTVKTSFSTLSLTRIQHLSQHRSSSSLLTAPPRQWQLHTGITVTRSASCRGDADPLGSPSAPADEGDFGSLSVDMSSRRSFRKSSPYIRDLRHGEDDDDAGEEEDSPVKPRGWVGRRNTPYWYLLQCKKLIKENKVSFFFNITQSCFTSPPLVCTYTLYLSLTAAGGFGFFQQRHAAEREAAAAGVQLHCPDRRLWSSWTIQKGLQTLQWCRDTLFLHLSSLTLNCQLIRHT